MNDRREWLPDRGSEPASVSGGRARRPAVAAWAAGAKLVVVFVTVGDATEVDHG